MDKNKPTKKDTRRKFFSRLITSNNEKVKLLTADGKLVEVSKNIFEEASSKKKAGNKEIYDWMDNPSKKNA